VLSAQRMGGCVVRTYRYFCMAIAGGFVAWALSACGNTPGTPPEPSTSALPGVFVGTTIIETSPGPGTGGARIDFLLPGGPAETAGLREDDIIISAGGNPVRSNADLIAALRGAQAGEAIPVGILRDGQPKTVEVRPEARPADYEKRISQIMADRCRSEEEAGAQDQAAGAYRSAFDHDVKALRLIGDARYDMPDGTQRYDRVLKRISALLPKLKPHAAVPPAAERLSNRAIDMLRQARSDDDNAGAAQTFALAIAEAPWVADLYRNEGLVRAKAGDAHAASIDLNRYLILNPGAPDAAAMRRKIADLAQLAAEEGPVARFVGIETRANGEVERLSVRGHTVLVSIVKPAAPPDPESALQPGDTLCAGTMNGDQFEGHCAFVNSDQKFVACFGNKRDFPANGSIEGNLFRIRGVVDIHYHSESCVIDSQRQGPYRTYRAM
jgi:hypothetical protein